MSAARWVSVIKEVLEHDENKTKFAARLYQLATVDAQNKAHVRTVGHGDILVPKGAPHLPLMLTSTYARSAKVSELLENPSVEIAWLLDGYACQFRISGRAFVVPSPKFPQFEVCVRNMARSLALAVLETGGSEDMPEGAEFSWEKLRRDKFDAAPPALRAKWAVPVAPGTVLSSYEDASKYPRAVQSLENATTEEDKKNWHEAFKNFALIVIEPTQVEWLQLGERPNRKTLWTRTEEDEWKEEILVP